MPLLSGLECRWLKDRHQGISGQQEEERQNINPDHIAAMFGNSADLPSFCDHHGVVDGMRTGMDAKTT